MACVEGANPASRMSSIIFVRNGVIKVILSSSHEAETNSRPSKEYPRSIHPATVPQPATAKPFSPTSFMLPFRELPLRFTERQKTSTVRVPSPIRTNINSSGGPCRS
jgi:hypothetical protein